VAGPEASRSCAGSPRARSLYGKRPRSQAVRRDGAGGARRPGRCDGSGEPLAPSDRAGLGTSPRPDGRSLLGPPGHTVRSCPTRRPGAT